MGEDDFEIVRGNKFGSTEQLNKLKEKSKTIKTIAEEIKETALIIIPVIIIVLFLIVIAIRWLF